MPTNALPPENMERLLYQLVISRIDGPRLLDDSYRKRQLSLVSKGLGGLIVFAGERDTVSAFIAEAQAAAETPLFIASDVERGLAQQISGTTPLSPNMAVAAATDRFSGPDTERLRRFVQVLAAEALSIGINMPLVPVLDVNRDPDNPIVCTRAFSDDPAIVAWFGTEYARMLKAEGLLCCAKHFPGHGDTSTDSHIALPIIRKTRQLLMIEDVAPFRRAIEAGVPCIMMGHLLVPALDDRPASLSRAFITDMLRAELGFQGLVLTDALTMSALDAYGDVEVECLKAGADVLLHPKDADETVAKLRAALRRGEISEEMIAAANGRLAAAKRGLVKRSAAAAGFGNHCAIARDMASRSVTAVKGSPADLAAAFKNRVHLVVAGEKALLDRSGIWNACAPVTDLDDTAEPAEDLLLVAVFTSVAAWKGSSGVAERDRLALQALVAKAKRSIVVSFGSPYVLRYFDKADGLIAAYDAGTYAQEAVVDCLSGKAPFAGKLPVKLR